MLKKAFKQLKKHKIFIISFISILFLFTFELPYTISKTGGIIDLSSRMISENDYRESGSFNMAYVSEVPATIPNILISYLNPNWDLEKIETSNETVEEMNFRGKTSLKESINNAFKIAYKSANMPYKERNQKVYVTYIFEEAKTDLIVGDCILSINKQKITSKKDISKIVQSLKKNEEVEIEVENQKQHYIRKANIIEIDNQLVLGIMVSLISDLKLEPHITIDFKKSESGASGGLMMALAIYDNLTGYDLTKGRKIAGTGTINEEGIVGEISGIKYKLKGAVNKKVEIFLVPSGSNYEEAIKEKEKNHYNITIVPIKTINEAIEYLKK